MLRIREAREEELLRVGQMWSDFMAFNAGFNDSFTLKKKGREIFSQEMTARFPSSDYRLAVAESDGGLVGFCFAYVSRKPRHFKLGKFGFIGDLYVEPQHRRRGIAKALVRDAMSFFEKKKVRQVELLVAIKNRDTIEFWQALGFSHLLTWMYKRI